MGGGDGLHLLRPLCSRYGLHVILRSLGVKWLKASRHYEHSSLNLFVGSKNRPLPVLARSFACPRSWANAGCKLRSRFHLRGLCCATGADVAESGAGLPAWLLVLALLLLISYTMKS